MTADDVVLSAEVFEAFRTAIADGPIDFDDLYARYDHETERFEFETTETTRTGLSEAGLHEAAEEYASYITNWWFVSSVLDDRSPDRVGFVRWLEAASEHSVPARYDALASGVSRSWGELHITATIDEFGDRSYELRHEDDTNVSADSLDAHSNPLDAREIGTFDERDRYRPLRTAPSLPTGWVFSDLSAIEVCETVDTFYPATIANWYRESDGTLDIDHWRDTAERQTGIYGIIDELDEAAVNRIAASCCVDSQCLKRREWEYDAETELAADGGSGVFPCREPCSLVVAAARKWTTLEREEPQTYEFELTPSEKEQLEALIDAVADDRTDDIREADVYEGANRYRARYLREKRIDEHGNLSGTPTHPEESEE
ncbi:DR2241 family protein [Halalkalirubrum salinum]|uniref:DR2241 family protein n=1 Tax=Halalkalirubrum salinum TaxID=2563889 RepID=UPI0010FB82F1|nr:DR2241 family protein [Halalkalirubrum salinum]